MLLSYRLNRIGHDLSHGHCIQNKLAAENERNLFDQVNLSACCFKTFVTLNAEVLCTTTDKVNHDTDFFFQNESIFTERLSSEL